MSSDGESGVPSAIKESGEDIKGKDEAGEDLGSPPKSDSFAQVLVLLVESKVLSVLSLVLKKINSSARIVYFVLNLMSCSIIILVPKTLLMLKENSVVINNSQVRLQYLNQSGY